MRRLATPTPKKTESTKPIATSSRSFVVLRISSIVAMPATPEIVAPRRRPGRDLPSPPSETITAKAIAMPGRVAWERASPMSERFLRRRKEPTSPAAIPSRVVLRTTRRVL